MSSTILLSSTGLMVEGGGATTNNGFHCIKNQHNVCGAAEVEHSNPNMKVIHWDVLQVDLPKDGLNVSCIMVTMTMTRTMMKKTERGCKTPPLYKHAFNIAFLIMLMCFNLIILVLFMIACLLPQTLHICNI